MHLTRLCIRNVSFSLPSRKFVPPPLTVRWPFWRNQLVGPLIRYSVKSHNKVKLPQASRYLILRVSVMAINEEMAKSPAFHFCFSQYCKLQEMLIHAWSKNPLKWLVDIKSFIFIIDENTQIFLANIDFYWQLNKTRITWLWMFIKIHIFYVLNYRNGT